MFSILADAPKTFTQILQDEWLGILASAFVLVSFLFTKQTITRLINICGCAVFVVYGILLPAYSTAFMNAALIVVHVVFLIKDYLARKKAKQAALAENADALPTDDDALPTDDDTLPPDDDTLPPDDDTLPPQPKKDQDGETTE